MTSDNPQSPIRAPQSSRGFWALIVTQFQGAFSDNARKWLAIFLITQAVTSAGERDRLVMIVGGLFAVPFILFSMAGGFLADRFSKRRVILGVKVFEIFVMLLALVSLAGHQLYLTIFCVFLMGVHSAIFGPSKYGLLPELLPEKKLSWGNGVLEFGTFIAIIAGTYYHSGVQVREFVARSELDKSRAALEASLQQLKENEMQLVQSEKLASLGRMSAGIIHEINNPLNFATTGLFTLRKKARHLAPEQQADYAEILTDIEDGLKRVQTIVSDLRMFTHPNTEQIDPVPVAEIVTPALRFTSNEWKDMVQIEQQFAAGQTILANKNKLIQVVVNLLQNSLDALKSKNFADGENPAIWIEGRVENGRSFLIVRDNGSGIDTKHLGKIFDPFFTTKDVGAGMGLGLSICYNIVQEYGGKISVKTEPGKFCEFTLEFPVQTQQAVN